MRPGTALAKLTTGMAAEASSGDVRFYHGFPEVKPYQVTNIDGWRMPPSLSDYRICDVAEEFAGYHAGISRATLRRTLTENVKNKGTVTHVRPLGVDRGGEHYSQLAATLRSITHPVAECCSSYQMHDNANTSVNYSSFCMGTRDRTKLAPFLLAWNGAQGVALSGQIGGDRILTSASFFVFRKSSLMAALSNGWWAMDQLARQIFVANYSASPLGREQNFTEAKVAVRRRTGDVTEAYYSGAALYGLVDVVPLEFDRRDPLLLVIINNVKEPGDATVVTGNDYYERGIVGLHGRLKDFVLYDHDSRLMSKVDAHQVYTDANKIIAGLTALPGL